LLLGHCALFSYLLMGRVAFFLFLLPILHCFRSFVLSFHTRSWAGQHSFFSLCPFCTASKALRSLFMLASGQYRTFSSPSAHFVLLPKLRALFSYSPLGSTALFLFPLPTISPSNLRTTLYRPSVHKSPLKNSTYMKCLCIPYKLSLYHLYIKICKKFLRIYPQYPLITSIH